MLYITSLQLIYFITVNAALMSTYYKLGSVCLLNSYSLLHFIVKTVKGWINFLALGIFYKNLTFQTYDLVNTKLALTYLKVIYPERFAN